MSVNKKSIAIAFTDAMDHNGDCVVKLGVVALDHNTGTTSQVHMWHDIEVECRPARTEGFRHIVYYDVRFNGDANRLASHKMARIGTLRIMLERKLSELAPSSANEIFHCVANVLQAKYAYNLMSEQDMTLCNGARNFAVLVEKARQCNRQARESQSAETLVLAD